MDDQVISIFGQEASEVIDFPRPLASSVMFELVTPVVCESRRRGAEGDSPVGNGESWVEEVNFEQKV